MKTLAQAWAERLSGLRAELRAAGSPPMDADIRGDLEREHRGYWWAEFCNRAEAGEELPPAVWRSAQREGDRRGEHARGWVERLKARNRNRRTRLLLP